MAGRLDRIQYPARIAPIPPQSADRLREQLLPKLSDIAYFVALLLGRSEAVPAIRGSIALAVAPATTTTISNALVTTASMIVLTAEDANAAAEVGAAASIRATYATGVVTLTHSASAGTRTFRYVILP